MARSLTAGLLLSSALVLGGCTTYYSVTDPTTGKTYYTTDYKEDDGSVHFTDAATEARVNINNSEVREITKDQYYAGMGAAKAPQPTTTVTTPAPAATTVTTPAATVTTSPEATTVTTPAATPDAATEASDAATTPAPAEAE